MASSASCRRAGSLPIGGAYLLLALPWPARFLLIQTRTPAAWPWAIATRCKGGDCLHVAHDALFVRRPHLFIPLAAWFHKSYFELVGSGVRTPLTRSEARKIFGLAFLSVGTTKGRGRLRYVFASQLFVRFLQSPFPACYLISLLHRGGNRWKPTSARPCPRRIMFFA